MGAQLGWEVPEEGWRKGPWTAEEDRLLIEYVSLHGEGKWNSVARLAGLKRNGKSCRLRWVNYLRPDLKRGRITPHEENIILELHARWGNRWSTIAQKLPGRTDNEIKNYWRTHFKKAEKVSSKDQTEKSKARLLRRQQFHNQQQLQLQQQQLQENQQVATRRFMTALLDESENINKVPSLAHQVFYPNSSTTTTTYEDHCMLSSMFNMPPSSSAADYICVEDQMLWSGLWNMDYIDASLDDINGAGRCNQ